MGKNYVFVDDLSPQDIEADVASQTVRLRREAGTTPVQGFDKFLVRQNDELVEVAFDSIDAAINNLAYRGATTFEVGAGKPYSSVNQVLDLLRDKILVSPILIKVADGIHEWTDISLHRHPYAHKIRIEGNVTNPANCLIRWKADSRGDSQGLNITSCRGLNFSGFKLEGRCEESNFTHRSIGVYEGSSLFCDNDSIIIDGGFNGVDAGNFSKITAIGLKVSNTKQAGVLLHRSIGDIERATINGSGKASRHILPARHGSRTVEPNGIWLINNSSAHVAHSNVSNLTYGIITERSSHAEASAVNASGCYVGSISRFNSSYVSYPSPTTGIGASATECDHGFISDMGSTMFVKKGTATGCSVVGFRSLNGSNLHTDGGGYAKDCGIGYQVTHGGLLTANGTSANSTGNTVNYDVDANSKLIWS